MSMQRSDISDSRFADSLERYLADTLHVPIRVSELKERLSIPSFLRRTYRLYKGRIADRRCFFLALEDNDFTPSQIARHILLAGEASDGLVVFATSSLSAYYRSLLVRHGIPFVIPGNQLYIPELAMDLRERFRRRRHKPVNSLSPVAQAVLFHHLLRRDESSTSPSLLSGQLHCSTMSVSRAFEDLVAAGIADTEIIGRRKCIRFKARGRHLFNSANDYLREPARAKRFVRHGQIVESLKVAGECALAELTDLSRPALNTFAVAAREWKKLVHNYGFVETVRNEADHIVETWYYDPAGLSNGRIVDPLSLYVQFKDHHDERVSMAAEKLLEGVKW